MCIWFLKIAFRFMRLTTWVKYLIHMASFKTGIGFAQKERIIQLHDVPLSQLGKQCKILNSKGLAKHIGVYQIHQAKLLEIMKNKEALQNESSRMHPFLHKMDL